MATLIKKLLALPFEEARIKVDALTDEGRKALALDATDWLVERLKVLIVEKYPREVE